MLSVRAAAWADLVRLPSVLTVPGDVLLGAAAAGGGPGLPRVAARAAGSCMVYLAGMALNDYADRHIDARERPSRPIPSGRVQPRAALALAGGLTAAGLATSGLAGGPGALPVAATLAATAWAYDLGLKHTALGPVALSGARFLDVLHGATPAVGRAVAPAAVLAGHTLGIGIVSRREARGGSRRLMCAALAGTLGVAAGALVVGRGPLSRRPVGLSRTLAFAASVGAASAFAGHIGRAQVAAAASPGPDELQRAVGAGVLGMVPLQASMLAALGPLTVPVVLTGSWAGARRLARRRPVT